MIELCICGHSNDHVGKPCSHPVGDDKCACRHGLRTDVAIAQQLSFVSQQLRDLSTITLEAHGLEIARDGKVVKKSGIVKLT